MSQPRARTSLAAVLAFICVSLLTYSASAAAAPIRIALEAPLSGSQASNGLDILRGAQLAVREANRKHGVLGRRVKLLKADDKGDQANAKGVAERVIRKKAVAVIGPYNSSVGIINLPIYLKNNVVPVHLVSTDDTKGEGITIQPKNSQIAPVEEAYATSTKAKRVAMLVDDTPNGAFTVGMADRLQQRLTADGVAVARISVQETTDNVPPGYYALKVAEALATSPDLIYVSTYFPEGAMIAQALAPVPRSTGCLMGLANVDPGFISSAGLAASQRCVFSGVPAAPQLPSAKSFVRRYRKAFKKDPGVWGVFAYDSAKLLFRAMKHTGGTRFKPVLSALQHTKDYRGQTGSITIDPTTGYRVQLPFLNILTVNSASEFVIAP